MYVSLGLNLWLRFDSSEPRLQSGLVRHFKFTATTQSGECHWLAFLKVAVPKKFTDSLIQNSKFKIQNSKFKIQNSKKNLWWSNSGSSEPRISNAKAWLRKKLNFFLHSGLVLHVNFTATTQSGECHWFAFLEVAVPKKQLRLSH